MLGGLSREESVAVVRVLVFLAGVVVVAWVLRSAIETVILPRSV